MHDIFYFTDVHGMYDLYRAAIDYCLEQDPECSIIYGGDAIDRGPRGYEIMKELLDNPQVIYLLGNHEDLFVSAAKEIKELFDFEGADRKEVRKRLGTALCFDYKYLHIQDALYNSGMDTLVDWVMDGMPMDLVEKIERLPRTFSYEKCDFCHAGGVYKAFKKVADAEYDGVKADKYALEHVIWNRTALKYGWETGRTCIFGHTPIQSLQHMMRMKKMPDNEIQPYKYVGNLDERFTGPKIDMDTGAFYGGRIFVLNVLTMKAQGFEDTEFEETEIRKHDVKKIECIQM